MDHIIIVIGGVCLLIVFALFAKLFYTEIQREKSKKQASVEEMHRLEEAEALPEPILRNARVIDKRFESDVMGTRSVRQVSSYFVTFFTEDGETVEYDVPREIFLQIEKGQESTLVTLDGKFFDFSDGEDASTEETE